MRRPISLALIASATLLLAACDGEGDSADAGGGGGSGPGDRFGSFFASAFNGGRVSATTDPVNFDGRPAGFAAVDPRADPVNF